MASRPVAASIYSAGKLVAVRAQLIFLFLGGTARPAPCVIFWGAATVLAGHALFRFWEVAIALLTFEPCA